MPQIDLITGALGAGKTTFIKQYAQFLIRHGGMVGILESDYGAVNIDMVLLEDLMGNNCDVEMITGGDGILPHMRRFRTKLISMAMTGYNRVIVEPSGIYDTDDFFDALEEEPLCNWYSPGSIIAIVDSNLPEELSEESEYLLVSQTACAGKVVLSRCGQDSKENEQKAQRILAHLNRALERFRCDRRLTWEDILAKNWERLTEEDYLAVALGGMVPADHVKIPLKKEEGYGTLFYFGTRLGGDELRAKLTETFEDPSCGNVMRVKGFVRTGEDTRVQINATKNEIVIEPTVFANEVLIVTGEGLHRERIDAIWAETSGIITPGDKVFGE
ncbi:MAG: GTPase (G3E family) [Lachnospiraceae bacterium]|nr:GTPase (G3E family) [Lachnospiraceae bacterium]